MIGHFLRKMGRGNPGAGLVVAGREEGGGDACERGRKIGLGGDPSTPDELGGTGSGRRA